MESCTTEANLTKSNAYSDASFLSEEGSKSRFGILFYVAGALICWHSANPHRIVSSSTESEIHGLVQAGKENIWETEFNRVLGHFKASGPTVIYQDNKAAITLTTGGTAHRRSKHFGMEYDLFRQYVADKELQIQYLHTDELLPDLLTKPLPRPKFERLRGRMMGEIETQRHFLDMATNNNNFSSATRSSSTTTPMKASHNGRRNICGSNNNISMMRNARECRQWRGMQ